MPARLKFVALPNADKLFWFAAIPALARAGCSRIRDNREGSWLRHSQGAGSRLRNRPWAGRYPGADEEPSRCVAGEPAEELRAAVEQALRARLHRADRASASSTICSGYRCRRHSEATYDAMDRSAREERKRSPRGAPRRIRRPRARPMLITVEDIHWAEGRRSVTSLRIAQTVARCAALLVMSARTDSEPLDPAWRGAMHGAPLTTLDLAPLREAGSDRTGARLSRGRRRFRQ